MNLKNTEWHVYVLLTFNKLIPFATTMQHQILCRTQLPRSICYRNWIRYAGMLNANAHVIIFGINRIHSFAFNRTMRAFSRSFGRTQTLACACTTNLMYIFIIIIGIQCHSSAALTCDTHILFASYVKLIFSQRFVFIVCCRRPRRRCFSLLAVVVVVVNLI